MRQKLNSATMRLFLLPFALLLSVSLAAQVPAYVPTEGLEIWTEFDGHYLNSLDGQVVWTEIGTPIFTNGRFTDDSAIRLPASGNFIKSATPWYLPSQDHTTSIWFKSDDEQNPNQTIINSDPHTIIGVTINPWWGNTNSTIGACIGPETGYWDMCSQFETVSADYEEWNHLVTVRTESEVKLFLNNVLVFERSGVAYNSTAPADILLGESSHTTGFTDHEFIGVVDQFGYWTRPLNEDEISNLFTAQAPDPGCTDVTACNCDSGANLDDGSCVPSGCMEEGACNYNAAAECEGEACDYSCCPGPGCCGAGTHWDANLATCIVDIPDTVDTACTLMNLQELASGYAALVEQNAALDSINLEQQAWIDSAQGNISNSPSGPCTGENSLNYFNQEYEIIEINERCWFAQNLNTSQYSNGDSLARNIPIPDWNGTSIGACDAYGFSTVNADTYGLLYNWHAVTDPRNLCPTSWHVASDSDWKSAEIAHGMTPEQADLSNFRGEPAGERFKASSANTPSWNGTDSLHFGGLPGGWRNENGSFSGLGTSSAWWTSSGYGCCYAQYRIMTTTEDRVFRNNLYYYFFGRASSGLSVRCVKD